MAYIPAGNDGMLVYFGGIQDPDKNGTASIPQPLDQIFLFDIGSSKWYKQRTTGRTPEKRLTTYACDAELVGGQHNIDLGRQNPEGDIWAPYKPSLTTYVVPTEIITAVGGERTGGAKVVAPSAGFDTHELSVLMTRKAANPTRTATRDVNIATATAAPNEKASLSAGAIAGIAVGVGVAVILVLAGCCMHLHQSAEKTLQQPKNVSKRGPTPYMESCESNDSRHAASLLPRPEQRRARIPLTGIYDTSRAEHDAC